MEEAGYFYFQKKSSGKLTEDDLTRFEELFNGLGIELTMANAYTFLVTGPHEKIAPLFIKRDYIEVEPLF
jgi:hypothetical protein